MSKKAHYFGKAGSKNLSYNGRNGFSLSNSSARERDVIEVKPVRTSLHLELKLKRPIFEWQGVPGRFFSMIHQALFDTLPVDSKDFSMVAANQLSEVRAEYAIYGGASSVALSSDALRFDFPQLSPPGDIPIVQDILRRVHDAFPDSFPELSYCSLELGYHQHLEFADEKVSPANYLTRFGGADAGETLKSVVVHPGAKFELVSENPKWKCYVGVERSLATARGVFVSVSISINDVDPSTPYEKKAEIVRSIDTMCDELLGFEYNATG